MADKSPKLAAQNGSSSWAGSDGAAADVDAPEERSNAVNALIAVVQHEADRLGAEQSRTHGVQDGSITHGTEGMRKVVQAAARNTRPALQCPTPPAHSQQLCHHCPAAGQLRAAAPHLYKLATVHSRVFVQIKDMTYSAPPLLPAGCQRTEEV